MAWRQTASTETSGYGTTGNAKFYAEQVRQLLEKTPQRNM
jgi:homoserine O-acetyltransferase